MCRYHLSWQALTFWREAHAKTLFLAIAQNRSKITFFLSNPFNIDVRPDLADILVIHGMKELMLLGRGCRNRRSQNPGIAKKGVGSDTCQDFFGVFVEVF